MSSFQIIGIALFACLMVVPLSRMIRRRSISKASLAWLLIWIAGIVALVAPDELTRLARVVGVNRGADLLLYISVVSGLLVAFVIYTRMRQTDRQITLIVRQLALNTVEVPLGLSPVNDDPYHELVADDAFFEPNREADLHER